MNRLRGGALVAATAALIVALAPGAGAAPTPITVPGGLRPNAAPAATFGDCAAKGVVCKPPGHTTSCSGYTSQTTPPTTIRVLVHTPSVKIVSVPFQQYVEDVLPNEWIPSWDGDALKAGAVAVKSYAWYWVTHYGGYLNTASPTTCFDVTDDTNFQVYVANSRLQSSSARTNTAVVQSWPVVARMGGAVLQAGYNASLHSPSETCGQFATGRVMSQWGSQNCVEESSGNKYNVILQSYYFPGLQLATQRQLRTQHDFTFEQTSTRVTYDDGSWALDDGYGTTFHFGVTGDVPVITDDGDGFAHIAVWRPSTGIWYLASPTGSIVNRVHWGVAGDLPVPGHYNGLSQPSVLALFRPSTGFWYIAGQPAFGYGGRSDIPVPGDYNGDGTTDAAVYRPSTGMWYVRGQTPVHYGLPGDIPVPADYDGDGKTDIAMYRPSNGTWYIRGKASVHYGVPGDIPVIGDFSGDGHADETLYRPGNQTWYTAGHPSVSFGAPGVTPIGAAPYRG